jgi:hypothetical protein
MHLFAELGGAAEPAVHFTHAGGFVAKTTTTVDAGDVEAGVVARASEIGSCRLSDFKNQDF